MRNMWRRSTHSGFTGFILASLLWLPAQPAGAAIYRWAGNWGGSWLDSTNWGGGPNPYPNLAGDVAQIWRDINAARTINLNASITLGGLIFSDGTGVGSHDWTVAVGTNGPQTLTMDNGASDAWISMTNRNQFLNVPIVLNSSLLITNRSASALVLSSNITENGGTRSITIIGNSVRFGGTDSTWSGGTTNFGEIRLDGDNVLSTGALVMQDGSAIGGNAVTGRLITNAVTVLGNILLGKTGSGYTNWVNLAGPVDLAGATRTLTVDTTWREFVISGPISNGGLTKNGNQPLTLSGWNTYADATTVNAGFLYVDGVNAGAGAVTVVGGLLGGSGSVAGTVTVNFGGALAPGRDGSSGTFTVSNDLIVASGATSRFDLGPSTTPGSGSNDLGAVTGNLWLDGALVVQVTGGLTENSPYRLFNYGGSLNGTFSSISVPTTRYTATPDYTTAQQVNISFAGATNLVWTGGAAGTGTGAWDIVTSPAWLADTEMFYNGDRVLFDGAGASNGVVNLTGTLLPGSVTVDSDADYAFAGTGRISGSATLVKTGAGTLTINNANDFAGIVIVSNGTLKAGNNAALGDGAGGTLILPGATLDTNAKNLQTEPVTVSGAGVGGAGAIINTAGAQNNTLSLVTLAGDTTFGGSGRWDVRGTGAPHSATLNGGSYTLTKVGTNYVALTGGADVTVGNIVVQSGTLSIETASTLNDDGFTVTVNTGGIFRVWNLTNVVSRALVLHDGEIDSNAGIASLNILTGPVTLDGSCTGNVIGAAVNITLAGAVGGSGGLVKTGNGTLLMLGTNIYSGGTTIGDGTVLIRGDNAFGSGLVTFASTTATNRIEGAATVTNAVTMAQQGVVSVTATVNAVYSGPIDGAAGLRKIGSGTLTLSGANTFAGNLDINDGTLALAADSSAGAGNVILSSGNAILATAGGTRMLTNAMTLTAGKPKLDTTGGDLEFTGYLSSAGDNDLYVTGGNALVVKPGGYIGFNGTGGLDIQNARVVIDGGAATNVNDGIRLYAQGGVAELEIRNGGLYQMGVSSGTPNLRLGQVANEAGTNLLRIGSGGTFVAGQTAVQLLVGDKANTTGIVYQTGGTVIFRSANADQGIILGSSAGSYGEYNLDGGTLEAPRVYLGGGAGVLNLNGGVLRVATNLFLSGFVSGVVARVGAGGAVFDTAGYDATVRSDLADGGGGGGLTKIGPGVLTLAGNNTYAGPTHVSNGTLRVNGGHGPGLITVHGGATLGGVGTVASVFVDAGGTLAPGNSAGTLTVGGNLTLSATSVLEFELDAPNLPGGSGSDFVTGVQALVLAGTLNVTPLAGFGTPVPGDRWLLIHYAAGSLTDHDPQVGSAPALDPGLSYDIQADDVNGDVYLTVIPEPASVSLAGLAAAMALLLRRRSRPARS